MRREIHSAWLSVAMLAGAIVLGGCGPKDFTAATMVMDLAVPEGFGWTGRPVTIDDPESLAENLGQDGHDLLERNWVSTTLGQMDSPQSVIKIAVHGLGSDDDAAGALTENKYPGAEAIGVGQEGYRWLDRGADETIFFRRGSYFAQLTIDRVEDGVALEPVAARLDALLGRRSSPF